MNNQSKSGSIDLKTAEQLARFFNVAFNGALLYGGDHPTTKKSTEPFSSILTSTLERVGTLSFVLDRESLFLEEVCLDKIINTKRIISQFTKAGILSVTFDRGVSLEDIQTFIKLSGDSGEGLTFKFITEGMLKFECKGIRLNYVRYGKITDDQAIVGKEFQGSQGTTERSNNAVALTNTTLGEIEKIASLSSLLEQPQRTASVLKEGIENPQTATFAINALTQLRQEINSSNSSSIDLLLNAVYELKSDLSEAIEAQKATGRILSMEDSAVSHVDQLTIDVIVKLVKEEYGKGLSLKRLSQIILRMLPDLKELKRVLPKLKNELLALGMPLTEYCQLVNLIDSDLESDMLSVSLTEAAEGIGVSVKEIVSAIKAQPSEAARLIYLAAEIRQGAHTDDTQLSSLLTDYIEKVTTDLALDRKELSGPQGGDVLRSILLQLEEQLINKLKKYGVENEVLFNVKNQLTARFEGLVNQASDKWLCNIIPEDGSDADDALTKITAFFGKALGADQKRDTLINALQNKGYDQERIDNFFKKLTDHVSASHGVKLPSNILSANNMLFLLNREIKLQIRYSIPFSTMMVTVKKVITEGDILRDPEQELIELLLIQVFRVIKKVIRETDLLGTLGAPFTDAIFVIMSMTGSDDAWIVVNRLRSILESKKYIIGNDCIFIQTAISVSTPIRDVTTEYKTYLELVWKNHNQVIGAQ